jgi:hypothetical protein
MTERKPTDLSWRSWIERQIHDGQQGGAFDDLRGHGRPIDGLDTAHDEMWWVKAKLRDEDLVCLPPTLAIRADRADAIAAALGASTEAQVRAIIDEVNGRIRYVNSHATAGPPSSVVTIDTDVIVDRWRATRPPPPEPPPVEPPAHVPAVDTASLGRWRRWCRRRLRRALRAAD